MNGMPKYFSIHDLPLDVSSPFVLTCEDPSVFYKIPAVELIRFDMEHNATIVYWGDDTKTTVRLIEGEKFSKDTAVAYAFMKKIFGGTATFHHMVERLDQDYIAAREAEARAELEAEEKRKVAQRDKRRIKKKLKDLRLQKEAEKLYQEEEAEKKKALSLKKKEEEKAPSNE